LPVTYKSEVKLQLTLTDQQSCG